MTSSARGPTLFEGSKSMPRAFPLGEDPNPLRLEFAKLFDQAANAVFLAGLDLDEVLVERLFIVHVENENKDQEVSADFLADAEMLKKAVLKRLGKQHVNAEGIEIRGVKIIARHDALDLSEPGAQASGGSC